MPQHARAAAPVCAHHQRHRSLFACVVLDRLNAINYAIKNRGLAREEEYPYIGKDGTCNKQLEKEP